jgi:histone-binding protein RBBP4
MEAQTIFKGHTSVVEDVCFSHHSQGTFASVSDDKTLKIWDIRQQEATTSIDAHTQEIFCVDYSPFDQNLLVTGSVDKSIAVWDARNLSAKLFNLKGHTDDVTSVKFSKMQNNMIASASQDRRIIMWDLSRIGQEQSPEEQKDGPPEMLFCHGGHTSKISDMSWNTNENLMMASVGEDNIIQIWQMAHELYYDKQEDELMDTS